jgi:group I intron endonuclease
MGAIRSTAQLLSYELVFSSIILILIIFSGSFSLTYIVECQQAVWNIFPLMPIALMFFIAILAETNRAPFDLPEARFGQLKNIYIDIFFNFKFTKYWKFLYLMYYIYNTLNITINKISYWLYFFIIKLLIWNLQRLNVNILFYLFVYLNVNLCIINNIIINDKVPFLVFAQREPIHWQVKFNNVNKLLNNCLKSNLNNKNITPRKIYDNINEMQTINNITIELKNTKGIYGFLCKINGMLYIGSSENLVKRFKEHIKGRKSNIRLQRAIKKHGLNNFCYIIFEFYDLNSKTLLIDMETKYISDFNIENLYNFKIIGQSMLGYKHGIEAIQKMLNRFKLYKHSMLGKQHTINAKERISLAMKGHYNPMFRKKHTTKAKNLISLALSKPVYMYKVIDSKLELMEIYPSSTNLVKLLNLNKSTISRYIKKGTIIQWKSNYCLLKRYPLDRD